jgi:hypothetical protein
VIRKIKNIKSVINIKTGYAAANHWSALFRFDLDGRTASDRGLAVLGSFSIFLNCV